MRSANGASLEQRAQGGGDFDLAGMAPERMDARVERRIRSARPVSRQRAGRKGGAEQGLDLEQADERVGSRELRAVEQREPLLGVRRERLEADFGERSGGRRDPIAHASLSYADHRRRHVRERCKIPRRAHGSLGWDHRRHAARKHGLDELKRLRLNARGALRQAAEFQRHHEPRCRDRRCFSDARSVRKDDVALKLSEVCGLDPHARQFAEASVDSVDRLATGQDPLNRRCARGDGGMTGRVDGHGRALPDRAPVGQRRFSRPKDDGHRPLQTRAWRGLKPSR